MGQVEVNRVRDRELSGAPVHACLSGPLGLAAAGLALPRIEQRRWTKDPNFLFCCQAPVSYRLNYRRCEISYNSCQNGNARSHYKPIAITKRVRDSEPNALLHEPVDTILPERARKRTCLPHAIIETRTCLGAAAPGLN